MAVGKFEEVRASTESLSDSEKIVLADILLSNTGMTSEVDSYWRQELRQRAARLRTDNLKTISLEEFAAKHETRPTLS